MDTAKEELSKRLFHILDVIGASEVLRRKKWESAMINELKLTLTFQLYEPVKHSFYHVGSSCEGTTTPGLNSDSDVICCQEAVHVVTKLADAKQQGGSFLIITDEDTKPGYVRLQIVKDQRPLTVRDITRENLQYVNVQCLCYCDNSKNSHVKIDEKFRLCFTHCFFVVDSYARNGPAVRTSDGDLRDNVTAFRCRQIPRSANSWLHRTRKYDWPSQKQLNATGSYGCFLVFVGHPQSEDRSIEYRLSFSLQERDFMSSLNETQHKCYILLKIIKNDLIEPKAGESISSYHCKTCLFYTIENSQRHFWTNDKLILCVQQCLKRLFIWVKAKHCPNYFIPEANMFDKLSVMTLEKIEYVLNDILESDMKFLYSLTCDNVGELLKSKLSGDELVCSLDYTSAAFGERYRVCYRIIGFIFHARNAFMRYMSMLSNTNRGYMNEVMQLLLYLQQTNNVTEHTTRDVRMALDSIIPLIQLQYKQCIFVQYLSQGHLFDLRFMAITKVISEISDCDLILSKLCLTSLYVQSEHYHEECRHILVSCEKEIKPFVVSVCGCIGMLNDINLGLAKYMRFTDISSKYFRRHCTTGCMVFHPSHVSLVHGSLQYEMFRSVYTQSGSKFEMQHDYWLNWITVDSKVYLYFLQYLLYSKFKNRTQIASALLKLARVLAKDRNLGHRETGFNLIGWIYLQENESRLAWKSFCKSWKIRPFKNAAKWHMIILLREIMKGN